MSRTYKATGINLKSMPLGESDRLLTILTQEFGLLRVVAPGARKQNSKLGGRSGLFVVNDLLLAKGRSLDKITQAETLESYPRLSQDLGKLAASQYLAEIVLCQALTDQPQEELYYLLNEHLSRLESLSSTPALLPHLSHAVFHLLALAGITPQVQVCCLTQRSLNPDFSDPNWQVGFSIPAGGTVTLPELERLQAQGNKGIRELVESTSASTSISKKVTVAEAANTGYQTITHRQEIPLLNTRINATELALLQQLAGAELDQLNTLLPYESVSPDTSWQVIEQILRQYTQYHLGRLIRSATLLDSYFASLPNSLT